MTVLLALVLTVVATLWVVGAFAPRGVAPAAKGADGASRLAGGSKRGYEALGDPVSSTLANRAVIARTAAFGGHVSPGSMPQGRSRWPDPGK